MSLATRVRPFVSQRTAAAGRALFTRGSVSILDGSEDSVVAAVRGRDVYRTEAAWSGGNLRISCTCPGFEGAGGPCAHLWASLLLADDRGLLETGLDGSRFRLIAPIALDRADRRVSAPSVGADDPDDPPVPTAGSPHPAVAIDFVPALRLFAPRAPRDGAVVDRPVYVLDREASPSSPGVVLDFLVQRRGSRRPVPARQVKLPIAHPRSIRDGQIAARLFDAIEQGWDGARPESLAIEGPVTLDDAAVGRILPLSGSRSAAPRSRIGSSTSGASWSS